MRYGAQKKEGFYALVMGIVAKEVSSGDLKGLKGSEKKCGMKGV